MKSLKFIGKLLCLFAIVALLWLIGAFEGLGSLKYAALLASIALCPIFIVYEKRWAHSAKAWKRPH